MGRLYGSSRIINLCDHAWSEKQQAEMPKGKGHNKKAFLGGLPLRHIHRFCARISARACVPWVDPSQQRMFIEYLLILSSFSEHPFQLYNLVQLRESEGDTNLETSNDGI